MEFTTRVADFGKAADRELFVKWVLNTEQNLFDQKVMFYPTTNTVMVEKVRAAQPGEPAPQPEPQVFIPFQATVTIESIAARPGITPREMALALRKWHDGLEEICRRFRIREIYFVVADDRVAEFALNHGYTEINGEKKGDTGKSAGATQGWPSLATWAKEHGYPGPIKRVLKMKLPGPEDKLPQGTGFSG